MSSDPSASANPTPNENEASEFASTISTDLKNESTEPKLAVKETSSLETPNTNILPTDSSVPSSIPQPESTINTNTAFKADETDKLAEKSDATVPESESAPTDSNQLKDSSVSNNTEELTKPDDPMQDVETVIQTSAEENEALENKTVESAPLDSVPLSSSTPKDTREATPKLKENGT